MKNIFQFFRICLLAQVFIFPQYSNTARAEGSGVVAPGCGQPGMCPTKASVPCKMLSCRTAAHQINPTSNGTNNQKQFSDKSKPAGK